MTMDEILAIMIPLAAVSGLWAAVIWLGLRAISARRDLRLKQLEVVHTAIADGNHDAVALLDKLAQPEESRFVVDMRRGLMLVGLGLGFFGLGVVITVPGVQGIGLLFALPGAALMISTLFRDRAVAA